MMADWIKEKMPAAEIEIEIIVALCKLVDLFPKWMLWKVKEVKDLEGFIIARVEKLSKMQPDNIPDLWDDKTMSIKEFLTNESEKKENGLH